MAVYQSKNKWHSQRIQKQFKNRHHNENWCGYSHLSKSLINYCNEYTKNVALKKRNEPYNEMVADQLNNDEYPAYKFKTYQKRTKSNWICNKCTYCNVERNLYCTICQFPFSSNNMKKSKNKNKNNSQKNAITLDKYITPILNKHIKKESNNTKFIMNEDDMDESIQIAIALSLQTSTINNNNNNNNQHRLKYTNKALLSVKSKFKSMLRDVEPIHGVFSQGLGAVLDEKEDEKEEKCNNKNRKKFSMNELLSVRNKYKSMLPDVKPINGVFGEGLGIIKKTNKPKTVRKKPIKNKNISSFESYWNEMSESHQFLKLNKKKIMKQNKQNAKKLQKRKEKKQERMKEKRESETKDSLEHFIGKYPTFCDSLQKIIDIRRFIESDYKYKSNFSLKCILNYDTFHQFVYWRRTMGELEIVYHGTYSGNDESIINRGLISGGKDDIRVRNGNVYGNGVYCSPDVWRAANFEHGSMFVCVVRKDHAKKNGNIWVIPNDYDILPLYLASFDTHKTQKDDGDDIKPMFEDVIDTLNGGKHANIFRFFPSFEPLKNKNEKDVKQRKNRRKWSAYYV